MPKLSIITVNLNNANGLRKTIVSVLNQTYSDVELIVVDGGSTDTSTQIIDQYKASLSAWLSEPDRGIYQAMNKGIRLAKGEYCLFLNSGDWLTNSTILQDVFAASPRADIVSGDVYYYDTGKEEIRWCIPSPDQLTASTLFAGTLPHQATFIKRALFEKFGPYNEQLRIAADWLFFLESLLVNNCTYQHHKGVISYFSMDGVSCNSETNFLPRQEQLAILRQKYPRFLPDYEHLELLEKQMQQWVSSREYRVYNFMKRVGIIRFGVFCRQVKRGIYKVVYR